MSALAGYVDQAGSGRAADNCRTMLAALRHYGSDETGQLDFPGFSFGCSARHFLPEDGFESQPLLTGDGRFAMALDGRIDNRSELANRRGIEAATLATMSDAGLMLKAWQRWQIGSFEKLVGDFAVAAWDSAERRLTLARSPLSLKPLFYRDSGGFLAFASMPSAILALPEVAKSLDWEAVAALGSGAVYRADRATLFREIRKILPGEAIHFQNGEVRSINLWNLDALELLSGNAAEFGDALREALDQAVSAQLRGCSGTVACHLSAGRDSSAVTASAALALDGEQLIALTAAPRPAFADGAEGDWLIDESELAAATARAHTNIRHIICRPDDVAIEDQLDELHRHHFAPLMNLSNMPWAVQLNRVAAEQGASILLTGSNGNFSISNGGRGYLIDLFREEGLAAWRRSASRIGGTSASEWLRLGHQLVAPWLPRPAYQLLRRLGGRATPAFEPLPTLAQPLRQRAEAIRAQHFRDWRPPQSYRDLVKQTLAGIDDAEKFSAALWGVDVRDPTSNRRVMELCLSLPASALFSTESDRPVYESAFAARLPPEILRNRKRGYQCADWFERFRPERIRTSFRRYLDNPLVRELVDQRHVEQLLDRWPATGWQDEVVETYRNQLLGTLAIASFVDVHFPA